MVSISIFAYLAALLVLFLKSMVAISLQGAYRHRSRRFRYAEDAGQWQGEAVAEEHEMVWRAQHLLRNDSETQPLFMAFGAAYVVLGIWPPGALIYMGGFAMCRVVHAYFLLRPRQPHRTLAFSAATVLLLALAVHTGVGAVMLAVG